MLMLAANFLTHSLKMKLISYSVIGALIGLIFGVFIGFGFDSFYTKKSERQTKQTIQVYLFGGIGLLVGILIGSKIAMDEIETKEKQIAYQKSLVEEICNYCSQKFQYSTLEFSAKAYCDTCINNIRLDYSTKCKEINKLLDGIELLKRQSAISNRLDKAKTIAESLSGYEQINLEFLSIKPSEIIKSIEDYRATNTK
jgi:uncharacterized membrane-anchored protein YhcB (DUF1043 family)